MISQKIRIPVSTCIYSILPPINKYNSNKGTNNMSEMEIQKLRFYRLVNGLLSLGYISFFSWIAAELYNMI